MFRRRSSSSAAPTATDTKPGGKGRPTPKRREAERNRRRAAAPRTRKEAYRQSREQARADRAATRAALLSGDERNLPPRDQGPVRRYVRDVVDSRRSAAEYFLFVAFGVLLLSFVRVPALQMAGTMIWLVSLVLIVTDSILLSRRLRRGFAERFPSEQHRGAIAYGLMRSLQIRRLRLPRPRITPGTKV